MLVNVRADDLPDPLATSFNLSLTRTANLDPRIALRPQAESELHLGNITFVFCCIFQPDFIAVGYSLATKTTTESQRIVEVTVVIIQPPSGRAPRSFSLLTHTEDGTASRFSLVKH